MRPRKPIWVGSTSGLTLIELIVVIALLGIIGTVLITLVNPMTQFSKAADTQRKNDLNQISKSLESYYNDHGQYPTHTTSSPTFRINDGGAKNWGEAWPPYLDVIPKDPKTNKNYVYWSSGQSFRLYASLDRANDTGVCNGGAACAGVPVGASCGSGICNYGISSPNISP